MFSKHYAMLNPECELYSKTLYLNNDAIVRIWHFHSEWTTTHCWPLQYWTWRLLRFSLLSHSKTFLVSFVSIMKLFYFLPVKESIFVFFLSTLFLHSATWSEERHCSSRSRGGNYMGLYDINLDVNVSCIFFWLSSLVLIYYEIHLKIFYIAQRCTYFSLCVNLKRMIQVLLIIIVGFSSFPTI